MKPFLLVCALFLSALPSTAQVTPTTNAVPTADDLPKSGEIDGAFVVDVVIMTKSDIGPFTRFLVTIPEHTKTYWFYVRNDDNSKALERGAIIGLLMGAGESYRMSRYWEQQQTHVNFTYSTVSGRREIETASLVSTLQH